MKETQPFGLVGKKEEKKTGHHQLLVVLEYKQVNWEGYLRLGENSQRLQEQSYKQVGWEGK